MNFEKIICRILSFLVAMFAALLLASAWKYPFPEHVWIARIFFTVVCGGGGFVLLRYSITGKMLK